MSSSGLRFRGFDFTVARRSVGDERMQEFVRSTGHLIDGTIECKLICLGGSRESAQFAHEL